MSQATVDAMAAKVLQGAMLAIAQGVPAALVTEAFYRAAVAMLITSAGCEATVATLQDTAERLEDHDDRDLPNSFDEVAGHA